VVPVLQVIPVFGVTPIDDIPVSVLNQPRRKMAGPDVVPGAIVVGSAEPPAPPGGVIIVVDVEEAKGHPHRYMKTKVLRIEKQWRL